LLHLKASRVTISQSNLKTGGCTMQMVHVASSQRSCGSEAEDDQSDGVGCGAVKVESKYPSLAVISFSVWMDILVF
jgi:hypothetical protein